MEEKTRIFPEDFSDAEISSQIRATSAELQDSGFNINSVLQKAPIIFLAQNELQKRIADQNTQASIANSKSSKRLSVIATVIALIALFAQLYFSTMSSKSDKVWQENELRALNELSAKLQIK